MKRAPERQLIKGDEPDEEPQETPVGFQKAPPEVLAKRKILKVRRTPNLPKATPAAPNPFSSVASGTPATSSPPASANPFSTLTKPTPPVTTPVAPAESEKVKPTETEPTNVEGKIPDVQGEKKEKETADTPAGATNQSEKNSAPDVDPKNMNGVDGDAEEESKEPPSEVKPAKGDSSVGKDATNVVETNATPGSKEPTEVSAETATNSETTKNESDATAVADKASEANGGPVQSLFGSVSTKKSDDLKKGPILFGSTTPSITFASAASGENGFGFKNLPAVAPQAPSQPKKEYKETKTETGEEDEELLFRARAKLYTLEKKEDGSMRWKERGIGQFKVNRNTKTQKARLLMRTEATLRLLLNTALYPQFLFDRATDRSIRFQGAGTDKDKDKSVSYLLRMSTKEDVEKLVSTISKNKGSSVTN